MIQKQYILVALVSVSTGGNYDHKDPRLSFDPLTLIVSSHLRAHRSYFLQPRTVESESSGISRNALQATAGWTTIEWQSRVGD